MRIAIYARVSKNDESQDTSNQVAPLRDYARALGGEIYKEYIDEASGGNGDRAGFLSMLEDADRRQFDMLLVWSLDRLTREGISNLLGYVNRLKKNNIALKSLQETWADTGDEHLGQLLLAIFAWVANFERRRLIARTRAGLARAKAEGKTLGRRPGSKDKRPRRRSGYLLRHMREGKK